MSLFDDTLESLRGGGHITEAEYTAWQQEPDQYEQIRREARLLSLGKQRRAAKLFAALREPR